MKVVGNYHDGKMFYENQDKSGRWAKVMVTKLSKKNLITCAIGDARTYSAFETFDVEKQIHGAEIARRWVEKAWY